ncbi:MAG: pyridoxine 5'-phosphate synthase [Pseudomonadota bacterium]
MPSLGVNIDHVATLRQARKVEYPDPVTAAALAELGGADSIVMHLREDRRHMQDRDLKLLRQTIKTKLNLEMAATSEMRGIALDIKPDTVTLVPERREELTTEGGLDVHMNQEMYLKYNQILKEASIKVSLFIAPDLDQIKAAYKVKADIVELHTGKLAEAKTEAAYYKELENIMNAAKMAKKFNLKVSAGHGLHYNNMQDLLKIEEIEEYNIGHSIIARAVFSGMEKAVRDMKEVVSGKW